MTVIYLIILVILWLALTLVIAFKPRHISTSQFELERLAKRGSKIASTDLMRLKTSGAINSVLRIKMLVLEIGLLCFAVFYFDWAIGIIVALLLSLISGLLANLRIFIKAADRLYGFFETPLMNFFERHPRLAKMLGGHISTKSYNLQIKSRDELIWLINESTGALTDYEKQLIHNSLTFEDQNISSVMTPRNDVISVDRSEFLGPLVLDELHKAGHSHLPVINGDIDHIIGILNISSLLSLDNKKSTTAEKAMDQRVYYIRNDHSLKQALLVFLRSQHRLLVVVDEAQKTVGVVVLKDVIEALVGKHDV